MSGVPDADAILAFYYYYRLKMLWLSPLMEKSWFDWFLALSWFSNSWLLISTDFVRLIRRRLFWAFGAINALPMMFDALRTCVFSGGTPITFSYSYLNHFANFFRCTKTGILG